MSKLTVEQAWQHVKALWPDAKYMDRFCMTHNYDVRTIDWPEGMDRYPPPEPTYREPTQDDVGKMVEVTDYADLPWRKCELLAVLPSRYPKRFLVDFHNGVNSFNLTRIAVDDAQTEDKSSANESQSCPIDEANTARLAQLKEPTHPEAQPIATAPKDRAVWLWNGRKWFVGWWSNFDWDKIGAKQITHWREIK